MNSVQLAKPTENLCSVCSFLTRSKTKKGENLENPNDYPETLLSEPESDHGSEIRDNSEAIVTKLEKILAESGLDAVMYLPSTNASKLPTAREASIKAKREDPKVDCEVVVDGKLKKFRFTVFDVIGVKKGPGHGRVIPDDTDPSKCVHLVIDEKGELNLVFDSVDVRNDFVAGFRFIVLKRGGMKMKL